MSNPNATNILRKNPDKRNNYILLDSNRYHIFKKNLYQINLFYLSLNQNTKHNQNTKYIKENLDKVMWSRLSINPYAIHLLAPLNHQAMQKQIEPLKNELLEYVFHPLRLRRLCDKLSIDLATLLSQY